MLVAMWSHEGIFPRLRAYKEDAWRFLTPPLLLSDGDVKGLASDVDEKHGLPVVLVHERMEGKLNLLICQGRVHVHFGRSQMNGSAATLAEALKAYEDIAGEMVDSKTEICSSELD